MEVYEVPLTFAEHNSYPRTRYQMSIYRTIGPLVSICRHILLFSLENAPINIFPQRGGGRDTVGIRQQNNPNPWELDRSPRQGVGDKILFLKVLNQII